MEIRRVARVIVGLTGVVLVWYALSTDLLNPRRNVREEPEEPLLSGRVTKNGGPVTALVELRRAPLPEPALAGRVELPFGEEPPAASVESREDGEFRFGGVPAGRYELAATGPDGGTARAWLRFDPEAPGEPVVLAIETGEGELRARARMANGAPFAGYVLAYTRADPGEPGGTWTPAVRPDGEGAFEILGFSRDRVTLAFVDPGSLRVVVPGVGMSGGPMVVDGGLEDRVGEVHDGAGAPVERATVWVESRDPLTGREAVHLSKTDAEGRFRARVLPEVVGWAVRTVDGATGSGSDLPPEGIVTVEEG